MFEFIKTHEVLVTIGAYWVFSSAVNSMPTPRNDSSPFYQWSFAFLHTFAGSLARVMAVKFPQFMGVDKNASEIGKTV